jgi:glycosyltransferase involved in cell wall biosynthesis
MTAERQPEVSIILPTYNRADVIQRALDSIVAQTHGDWELLVVDDGSTDGTCDAIVGLDARIRILRQKNAGTYVARNTGLRNARGRFITFMDSDDAWLPHFLELTTAFLRASPEAHFVTTEFSGDLGAGAKIRHDAYEIGQQYPAMANAIGSHLLDLPHGETDDYLRVYRTREVVGAWGREICERIGAPEAMLYRGRIFEHMRWGYLGWLPVTVLTRHALETVGPFTTHTRSAADYRFLGLLTKAFEANMIGVVSAVKHESASGAKALRQDHLARGQGAYTFEINKLSFFDELFWSVRPDDRELGLLRCHYQHQIGRVALRGGRRSEAIRHLGEAARFERRLWVAHLERALARLTPSDDMAGGLYRGVERAADVAGRLVKGEIPVREKLTRLFHATRS